MNCFSLSGLTQIRCWVITHISTCCDPQHTWLLNLPCLFVCLGAFLALSRGIWAPRAGPGLLCALLFPVTEPDTQKTLTSKAQQEKNKASSQQMGRRPAQTCQQGRQTGDKEAHEKMFHIMSRQAEANKTIRRYHSCYQNGQNLKSSHTI